MDEFPKSFEPSEFDPNKNPMNDFLKLMKSHFEKPDPRELEWATVCEPIPRDAGDYVRIEERICAFQNEGFSQNAMMECHGSFVFWTASRPREESPVRV